MFNSLRPHGLQHTSLPSPPLSPGVCSSSCPLSRWCCLTISSSVVLYFCLQSFPATQLINASCHCYHSYLDTHTPPCPPPQWKRASLCISQQFSPMRTNIAAVKLWLAFFSPECIQYGYIHYGFQHIKGLINHHEPGCESESEGHSVMSNSLWPHGQ